MMEMLNFYVDDIEIDTLRYIMEQICQIEEEQSAEDDAIVGALENLEKNAEDTKTKLLFGMPANKFLVLVQMMCKFSLYQIQEILNTAKKQQDLKDCLVKKFSRYHKRDISEHMPRTVALTTLFPDEKIDEGRTNSFEGGDECEDQEEDNDEEEEEEEDYADILSRVHKRRSVILLSSQKKKPRVSPVIIDDIEDEYKNVRKSKRLQEKVIIRKATGSFTNHPKPVNIEAMYARWKDFMKDGDRFELQVDQVDLNIKYCRYMKELYQKLRDAEGSMGLKKSVVMQIIESLCRRVNSLEGNWEYWINVFLNDLGNDYDIENRDWEDIKEYMADIILGKVPHHVQKILEPYTPMI